VCGPIRVLRIGPPSERIARSTACKSGFDAAVLGAVRRGTAADQHGGIVGPLFVVRGIVAAASTGECDAHPPAEPQPRMIDRPVWDAGAASGGTGTTHKALRCRGSERSFRPQVCASRAATSAWPRASAPMSADQAGPTPASTCGAQGVACRCLPGASGPGTGSRSGLSPASTGIGIDSGCVQPGTGGSDERSGLAGAAGRLADPRSAFRKTKMGRCAMNAPTHLIISAV